MAASPGRCAFSTNSRGTTAAGCRLSLHGVFSSPAPADHRVTTETHVRSPIHPRSAAADSTSHCLLLACNIATWRTINIIAPVDCQEKAVGPIVTMLGTAAQSHMFGPLNLYHGMQARLLRLCGTTSDSGPCCRQSVDKRPRCSAESAPSSESLTSSQTLNVHGQLQVCQWRVHEV